MKTIECYKVTINSRSICARDGIIDENSHNYICEFQVSYEIGKVTTPKIGKLYCFTSFEAAKSFSQTYRFRAPQIFKGIGTNPEYMKLTAIYYTNIKEFWARVKAKKNLINSEFRVGRLPHSSVCVDSFEPQSIVCGNIQQTSTFFRLC